MQLIIKKQMNRAGQFLPSFSFLLPSTAACSENNINELKGKELLDRLHEVGTLAQITSIQGDQVVLIGHRRIQISELVDEVPLTVKIDHLKWTVFTFILFPLAIYSCLISVLGALFSCSSLYLVSCCLGQVCFCSLSKSPNILDSCMVVLNAVVFLYYFPVMPFRESPCGLPSI